MWVRIINFVAYDAFGNLLNFAGRVLLISEGDQSRFDPNAILTRIDWFEAGQSDPDTRSWILQSREQIQVFVVVQLDISQVR